MCGVIGVLFEREKPDLGELAGRLLKMLEYRGYDSTGALFQDSKKKTVLKKDVGAPSRLVSSLKIDKEKGQVFCGQVRWATFGAVTRENAQPHEVACKTHFFGAHNGNITNCDSLKEWLISEGHQVKSDNDGEMVVHTVEHFFAELLKGKKATSAEQRIKERQEALKGAVLEAAKKIVGSFAAVVFDPETETMAAIKAGSSLYVGMGHDEISGSFIIASSDLGSVLSMTKILLPIAENEFAMGVHNDIRLYHLRTGEALQRSAKRTLLQTVDTQLQAPYKYFMEQEIHSQVEATRKLIRLYTGKSPVFEFLRRFRGEDQRGFNEVIRLTSETAGVTRLRGMKDVYEKFLASEDLMRLAQAVEKNRIDVARPFFSSSLASFLDEVKKAIHTHRDLEKTALGAVDALFELLDTENVEQATREFVDEIVKAWQQHKSVYLVASGSSYHAAKTASLFFNEMAGVQILPVLPGEFRAQCESVLKDGDVLIGISQSGETKDLIDIFNQVDKTGVKAIKMSVVNNINSTLAQEKSKVYLPLFCGPEIAVPATKSFMSQIVLLYFVATRVAMSLGRKEAQVKKYADNLEGIPALIDATLCSVKSQIDEIAEVLFLEPSLHVLATKIYGVGLEGALKIREVVLNHTQGYESSEFKHGPNTILGVNTVFGLDSVRAILKKFADAVMDAVESPDGEAIDARGVHRLFSSVADYAFQDKEPRLSSKREKALFTKIFEKHNFFESMYRNYPLVFLTVPTERDVNLTVSQINTHKIRGANIFMIAEENAALRKAVSQVPATGHEYKFGYAVLPKTDDPVLAVFSGTIALQLLALRMSVLKMSLLDRLEIEDHGVHPDAPKNVSKSVTVD